MKKYTTTFNEETLINALHGNDRQAKEMVENPERWMNFKENIDIFIRKAYKIPVLGGVVDDIVSMTQMVDSYVKKEYVDVPVTTIISIIAALIYLLSPIDLIPDAIPVIGYVDDVAIILLVLKLGVGHNLEKYKLWQECQREDVIAELESVTGKLIFEILDGDNLGALILSNDDKFRVLTVGKEYSAQDDGPYPVKVNYLNMPIDILKDMFLESEADHLAFLNGIIEHTEFKWSPIGKLSAIHEADYKLYEEYFALMGSDEQDE